MKLNDALAKIKEFSSRLPEFKDQEIEIVECPINNERFSKWFRTDVPAKGFSKKSGVYFIVDMKDDILYIGKATTGNFGREIWGNFGTAEIIDKEADIPRFIKSRLARYAPSEDLRETVISGNFKIAAVCIEPAWLSSLFEVFLHTLLYKEKKDGFDKETLNKRIG